MRCAVVLLLVAFLTLVVGSRYHREMKKSLEAQEVLTPCLTSASGQNLATIRCLEAADEYFAYNASWKKQLGALYTEEALLVKALRSFNDSADLVKSSNGFTRDGKSMMGDLDTATILKVYGARELTGAVELGKLVQRVAEMQGLLTHALDVHTGFLLQVDESKAGESNPREESLRFLERTAAVDDAVGVQQPPSVIEYVSEVLPFMARHVMQQFLAAPLLHSDSSDIGRYFMDTCGTSLVKKSWYTAREVLDLVSGCVAKASSWTAAVKKAPRKALNQVGAVHQAPVHRFAAMGTKELLRQISKALKSSQWMSVRNAMQQTAMHVSVGHGHSDVATRLKAAGVHIDDDDHYSTTPLQLGCDMAFYKKRFHGIVFTDDECEDFDERPRSSGHRREVKWGKDGMMGGWAGAAAGEHDLCQIDAEDGTEVTQAQIVGRYLLLGRPVVLRNLFASSGVNAAFTKKEMLRNFSHVAVKRERIPEGERAGVRNVFAKPITTLGEFYNSASPPTGHFGVIHTTPSHPFRADSVFGRVPPPLSREKKGIYVDVSEETTVLFHSPGAVSNHAVRFSPTYHTVYYGTTHWTLLAPPVARTTRDQAPKHDLGGKDKPADGAYKCTLSSGDVLVLPAYWSAAVQSITEGVSEERIIRYR